jgi:predicted transposase YbfD/YdcC
MEFEKYFSVLEDPRDTRKIHHLLIDIIGLSVLGTIAGCQSYDDIEEYGNTHEEWLKKHLSLLNGIPSHDTIERVFESVNPKSFASCFSGWVNAIFPWLEEDLLHIDGKSNRASRDKGADKKMLHTISAFAGTHHLSLLQLKVEDKTNEITAIPELIDMLDIKGRTVTTDALGCQKDIAAHISDKKGFYVLAVKGNQDALLEEIETAFLLTPIESSSHSINKGHGRIEERQCDVISDLHFIDQKIFWAGICRIIRIISKRTISGNTTSETRYFISNKNEQATYFARAIRSHWGIENRLHWVLDVLFDEDHCRKNKANAAENFNLIRKIALNIIRQYKGDKLSLKRRRLKAGWDTNYLDKLLKS